MSWSVEAVGKPAAVKSALASQFEAAKKSTANISHEQEAVVEIESVVNGQLDFLAAHNGASAVTVKASGSASLAPPGASWPSTTQVALEVSPIHGFVE
jgi:hypothetical protein